MASSRKDTEYIGSHYLDIAELWNDSAGVYRELFTL